MDNETEEKKSGKIERVKRGRKLMASLAKTNVSTRLFMGNKMHIARMVKNYRFTDPNFNNQAAAIRHYVNIGIQAETATSDVRYALENSVVKNSIKDGLREELKSHTNNIKKFDGTLTDSLEEFRELFADLGRRSTAIETRLDTDAEKLRRQLDNNAEKLRLTLNGNQQSLVKLLERVIHTDSEALRNIIVLRSVIYVFLLGYKTGKIKDEQINLVNWTTIVEAAHEKANALSIEEVKMLAAGTLEAGVIQRMAQEIFLEAKKHPTVESDAPGG